MEIQSGFNGHVLTMLMQRAASMRGSDIKSAEAHTQ
jgi:hypothetical protein